VNPNRGGTGWSVELCAAGVLTRSILDSRPVVLAGTESGVFVSDDGGASWSPFPGGDGPRAVTSLSTCSTGALYAGSATGVWRFDDGNTAWRGILDTHVHAVAVLGTGPDGDTLIAGMERDGAVRSEDGGRTWRSATAGLLDATVLTLAVSPPDVGDRVVLAGTPSGIYVSRNDGKAWRYAALPGARDDVAVQCLAVAPDWSAERVAFAGTEDAGLLRSIDGGMTWEPVSQFVNRAITAVAYAPRSRVVVASGPDLAITGDGGESWHVLADASDDIWSLLVIDNGNDCLVLAGLASGGVARYRLDR
jgi:photosystem II stability/assembly factor-like uncharacterized protein